MLNGNQVVTLIILVGTVLRIAAAIVHIDLIHPDEHFQVLEPANLIVNGFGWKSWEWYHGTRSWAIPAMYMPLLYALKIFGITAGQVPVMACRAFTALLSGVMLLQFDKLLVHSKIAIWPRICTLIFISFLPAMIVWSGSTFSDTWGQLILWTVMPLVCEKLSTTLKKGQWIWAGVLIGLTFIARVQMALWPIGIAVCVLIFGSRDRRRLLPYFFVGYSLAVIAQGFLDLFTWGTFLQSTVENIKKNLFEGVADMNGTSPWYFYIVEGTKNFGLVPALILGPGSMLLWVTLRPKFDMHRMFIVVPTVLFAALHMAIGHKELRFFLPIFPEFFYVFSLSVDALFKKSKFMAQLTNRTNIAWVVPLLAVAAPLSLSGIYSNKYYADADSSNLSVEIYKDGAFKSHPNSCLLLVDQYWHWTRGEMVLGQKIKFEVVSSSSISKEFLEGCAYAIVSSWGNISFKQLSHPNWTAMSIDHWGHVLYKNNLVRIF